MRDADNWVSLTEVMLLLKDPKEVLQGSQDSSLKSNGSAMTKMSPTHDSSLYQYPCLVIFSAPSIKWNLFSHSLNMG